MGEVCICKPLIAVPLLTFSLLPPACAQYNGALGLQTYRCFVESTIVGNSVSGSRYFGSVLTYPGSKFTNIILLL